MAIESTTAAPKPVLSDVQRLVQQRASASAKSTGKESYTEQEWYLRAKVNQLKGQIATYSAVPGLDPSGAIMDSLTKEVNALVKKQQEKLKASQAEGLAKQKELDEANAKKLAEENALTPDELIQRSKDRAEGKFVASVDEDPKPAVKTSKDVFSADDLLARSAEASGRGSNVNTSA